MLREAVEQAQQVTTAAKRRRPDAAHPAGRQERPDRDLCAGVNR
jgi:hypothetical protein